MNQITSKVELRQFAIEQANIIAGKAKIYTVDNLIDAAKAIEKYVLGTAKLREAPEDNTKILAEALAKSYNKNSFKMNVVDNDKFNN